METIKLNIKNKNNENLVCEINKSDNQDSINNPSILILHALTGKKENRTINFLAKKIPDYGYNTIQFDFSGHGESEGRLEEATVTKQLEDIKSVLSQINQINTDKIILIGNSFSVITALAFAENNNSIAGLILISSRANYLEYTNKLEKVEDKYRLFEDHLIDESFIEDYKKYNPLKNIKLFKNSILIIHGENDGIIPKEDAELFYSLSVSNKKDLFIVPNAEHRYLEIEQKENILSKVIKFLNKNFKLKNHQNPC